MRASNFGFIHAPYEGMQPLVLVLSLLRHCFLNLFFEAILVGAEGGSRWDK